MRISLTVAVSIAMCASMAQGQMILYEDFESYPVDTTIHLQGTDTTVPWGEVPRWYVNGNYSQLVDPELAKVRDFGDNNVLEMTVMSPGGFPTAMSMESVAIAGLGTIYLRYAVNQENGTGIMTNDLEPGWDYDSLAVVDPGTMGADGWQEGCDGSGWQKNGAIAELNGDSSNGFYARDGGSYCGQVNVVMPSQEWIEMWIQVDHANDRTQYWVCQEGGTPIQVLDAGGDVWWSMRNEGWDNNAVENLKIICSGWGHTGELFVYLDTIGVNTTAMTLERVGPAVLPNPFAPALPGDFDGDGDVDLDDFVILKQNFGLPNPAGGDADGDGDVDLDDFVILKQSFGTAR